MTPLRLAAAAALACTLLAGCATPRPAFPPPTDHVPLEQVRIASRFPAVEVTRETFEAEARRCVPTLATRSDGVQRVIEKFPSPNLYRVGHASSAHFLLLHKTTALCVQRTATGYPVLAAETFLQTVNPQGVPPDQVDAWYRRIAMFIATKGTAKVAYAFDNGNAFVADYWVEAGGDAALHYASQFRKAGEWEAITLDATFSHPSLTAVSEVKRGGTAVKRFPLSHRS